MSSRLTRLARAIVHRYPKAWRARYEIELVGYIEDSPTGWRDVFDLARGCVVERARAFVEPEAHPTRAWMLFGIVRFVPALAWYGVLVALASVLRRSLAEPPGVVVWAAFISFFLLIVIGFRAWYRATKQGPFGPFDRVPPRWAVASGLALFSISIVVIYWVDPSGNPSSRLGRLDWFSRVYSGFLFAWFIRTAFDLYWPSARRRSGELMRIGWLREQLGWARMELQRCESLAEPGGGALASGARAIEAAPHSQMPVRSRRLQDIADARQQLDWSREQRERLEREGPPVMPVPPFAPMATPRLADVRAELARARDEVQRIEAELRDAFASLRTPR